MFPEDYKQLLLEKKAVAEQITQEFVVLIFPPFFTPNNDSYNDRMGSNRNGKLSAGTSHYF